MKLEKWYCDVVDNGFVQIHYLAALRLGNTSIAYQAMLSPNGNKQSSFKLGLTRLPSLNGRHLRWQIPSGELLFTSEQEPKPCFALWQTTTEHLSWQPVVLNGAASGPELSPSARGYAEVLRMDFGPWKLGLKTLIWGRFCGLQTSLVWIVWEGAHPKSLALLDGEPVEIASVNEQHVAAAGVRLEMHNPQVLVRERMDQGSLKDIPLRGPLARLEFLRGMEVKWHSRATVKTARGLDHGHAIFERVTWD